MNAVWPLLSGVRPNDPSVAPPFVDPREVLEGEPQVEEGVLDDMPTLPTASVSFHEFHQVGQVACALQLTGCGRLPPPTVLFHRTSSCTFCLLSCYLLR